MVFDCVPCAEPGLEGPGPHEQNQSLVRSVLTICFSAFSLRRYQRHWPCLVASTRPALVRIAM